MYIFFFWQTLYKHKSQPIDSLEETLDHDDTDFHAQTSIHIPAPKHLKKQTPVSFTYGHQSDYLWSCLLNLGSAEDQWCDST